MFNEPSSVIVSLGERFILRSIPFHLIFSWLMIIFLFGLVVPPFPTSTARKVFPHSVPLPQLRKSSDKWRPVDHNWPWLMSKRLWPLFPLTFQWSFSEYFSPPTLRFHHRMLQEQSFALEIKIKDEFPYLKNLLPPLSSGQLFGKLMVLLWSCDSLDTARALYLKFSSTLQRGVTDPERST